MKFWDINARGNKNPPTCPKHQTLIIEMYWKQISLQDGRVVEQDSSVAQLSGRELNWLRKRLSVSVSCLQQLATICQQQQWEPSSNQPHCDDADAIWLDCLLLLQVTDFQTPIVLDTGSGLMKAGFVDQDFPTVTFPTIIGVPKYEVGASGDEEVLFCWALLLLLFFLCKDKQQTTWNLRLECKPQTDSSTEK